MNIVEIIHISKQNIEIFKFSISYVTLMYKLKLKIRFNIEKESKQFHFI